MTTIGERLRTAREAAGYATDAELDAVVLGVVQRWDSFYEPCALYYITGAVFGEESLDGVTWTWARREVQQSLKRLKKAGRIAFERNGFGGNWRPCAPPENADFTERSEAP